MQSSSKTSTFDKELAETLCGLELPKKVKISPNRKHVVYSSSPQAGLRKGKLRLSTLWIASTTEPISARKLTSGNYFDVEPVWHPDGNQILFVSDRNSPGKPSAIFGDWMGEMLVSSHQHLRRNPSTAFHCRRMARSWLISRQIQRPRKSRKTKATIFLRRISGVKVASMTISAYLT